MKRHLFAAVALGTVAIGAGGAHAAPLVAAVAPASDAEKLIALLMPEKLMRKTVEQAVVVLAADESKLPAARKALYAANPGMKDYVVRRATDMAFAVMLTELPSLRAELSAMLDREMTPAEISQVFVFFSSPTGQKMLAQVYAAIGQTGATDEEAAKQAAVATMMASLTEEDYPALMAFGTSPGAKKLQGITPKLKEVSAAWTARMTSAHSAEMIAAGEAAIAEFKAGKR